MASELLIKDTTGQQFNPKYQKLLQMQSLSLEEKIHASKLRIKEFHEHFDGQVHVSFSGGADSTVLLDLCRRVYPDTKAVFCNTGLEYPEIVRFVKSTPNVDIVRPKMSFKEVLNKYGYPVISKEVAKDIREIRTTKSEHLRRLRLYGDNNGRLSPMSKLPSKYLCLLDAPFKISDQCCSVLKKAPLDSYGKQNGTYAIVGVQAEESMRRKESYMRYSCNAFLLKKPQSRPLMFWRKQDTLQYLKQFNIPYCKDIYGEIVQTENGLKFTKENRTGCVFCMFGAHKECPTRFQRLQKTHPSLWRYCLEDIGLRPVLDYLKIPYKNDQLDMFEENRK